MASMGVFHTWGTHYAGYLHYTESSKNPERPGQYSHTPRPQVTI